MPEVIVDISSLDISVNVTDTERDVDVIFSGGSKTFICNFTRAEVSHTVGIDNTNKQFTVSSGSQPIIYDDLNELSKYQLENFDLSGDPIYCGYMDKNANWYIAKIDTVLGDKLYAAGLTDYQTNWDDRVNLTYETYAQTF